MLLELVLKLRERMSDPIGDLTFCGSLEQVEKRLVVAAPLVTIPCLRFVDSLSNKDSLPIIWEALEVMKLWNLVPKLIEAAAVNK